MSRTTALVLTSLAWTLPPETARRQLPRDGAVVFLIEYRELAANPRALAKLRPRPERFRLDRPRDLEWAEISARTLGVSGVGRG